MAEKIKTRPNQTMQRMGASGPAQWQFLYQGPLAPTADGRRWVLA